MKHQVKFYVDDIEKKRLEHLAKLRYMTVPAFAKMTSLGVQIEQVQEVYIENNSINQRDRQLLEKIIRRYDESKRYMQFDTEFNQELYEFANRYLQKGR